MIDSPWLGKPRKPSKKRKVEPFEYMLAFGDETVAEVGQVLFRVSRSGRIVLEEHMNPGEFLRLAGSFEQVANGIRNVLDGKPVG